MRLRRLLAASALAISSIGVAQADKKLADEFSKLRADYFAAQREYFKPYEKAKTEEESNKIKLDPAKDPAKKFLPRFKAFATKAKQDEAALEAWMMVLQMSGSGKPGEADQVVNRILKDFKTSAKMAQFASALQYQFFQLDKKVRIPKIEALLLKIQGASPHANVKAQAIHSRASLLNDAGPEHAVKAKALMAELLKTYPNTEAGKRANRDLFEMENLVVGKVAPDIEGTDENGVAFKLSDYRGKVVVLDFWGFW